MWNMDPVGDTLKWLAELLIQLVAGTIILIVALGIKDTDTPLAPYYLSGGVFFGIAAGRLIERWRRSRQ